MISPSSVVTRSEEPIVAPMGEELAMMDVEAGTYFVLDDIATAVWSRIAAPTRVDDLVADLRERYDVTEERCRADVVALLRSLHEKGLVRIDG